MIAGLGIGTGLTYQMPSVIIRANHPIYTLQSTLTDTDYHFSLKYPEPWELQMTIDEMRGSDFRPE